MTPAKARLPARLAGIYYIVSFTELSLILYTMKDKHLRIPSSIAKKILDAFLHLGYNDSLAIASDELSKWLTDTELDALVRLIANEHNEGNLNWLLTSNPC